MNRDIDSKTATPWRALALRWTAALALLGTSACTHANPEAIFLLGSIVAARQAIGPGQVGECYHLPTGQYRSHGTLDLMVYNKYDYFPEIINLLPRTDQASGNSFQHLRQDASTVMFTGAEVSLEVNKATGPLAAWNPPASLLSWYVPLQGAARSGENWRGRFPILPATVGEQLRGRFAGDAKKYTTMQRIVLNVAIEGEMLDGTVVKTQTAKFPIDLCWGCLVSLGVVAQGVGVVDPEDQYAYCSSKQVAADYIPPCVPGNDEFMPCGLYCQHCDLTGTCDDRFCPSL